MSECVVVMKMKMPERCYDCDLAEGLTCMATGGYLGRDIPKMTFIKRRPDWCPIICALPENHGPLVDFNDATKELRKYGYVVQNETTGMKYMEYPIVMELDPIRVPVIVPAKKGGNI